MYLIQQNFNISYAACHSGKRSATRIGELYYKMYVLFRLLRTGKDSGQAGMTQQFFQTTKLRFTIC